MQILSVAGDDRRHSVYDLLVAPKASTDRSIERRIPRLRLPDAVGGRTTRFPRLRSRAVPRHS
ncbi:hypothetical protein [Bauldia sp.]|uniref:hypothetical protein n=1 Tax=Bauldia sp. TaxID=2575872 RepID=UPI003BAA692E